MKLAGLEVSAKYIKEITFHRPDRDYVFKLEAVGDYHDFEVDHPQPEPPTITKDGKTYLDRDDEDFIEELQEWSEWRVHWILLNTIQDVEWKTITCDPSTFENWHQEMVDSGFSQIEVSKLQNEVMLANGLMEPEVMIPSWIKDIAAFWCADEIGSGEFVQVIQWMIKEGLIMVPQDSVTTQTSTSSGVPDWIQFNACIWHQGEIGDKEFSTTLQWLIDNEIIKI